MTDTPHSPAGIQYLQANFRLPHDGDMVEWAHGRLNIPYSTQYPVFIDSVSPWLLEPLRAISHPKIRRVDLRMPAAAAKSLVGEITIAYAIAESHGLIYYVWQTDDDAKDAMEDRIFPLISANDFLHEKMPVDRNKKRTTKIAFPRGSLYAVGANLSAAQSKRVTLLIMEEPHLYDPGMMKAFEDRTTGVKNPKIVTLSTGSIVGDDSDLSFNQGSREEWQVPCPHCREFQTMTDHRDRLRATIDENSKDENGEYNWPAIMPTVHYACEHCGMDWPTDAKFRHEQAKEGRYIVTNTNAPEDHRSFHVEAVSIYYEGFALAQTLEKKLTAVDAYKRGAIEPFKNYMQKTRAMAWDESPEQSDDDASFERAKGEYDKLDPFDGEIARFLCVDNQAGKASRGQGAHRWYVCRAFSFTESRLIDEGRVTSWEEVEEKRIKLGVEPLRTLVDCAWDTANVQGTCVRYGWQGLWGDTTDKKSFPHYVQVMTAKGPERIARHLPFSTPQIGHVGIGKAGQQRQSRYFFWCNGPVKDVWHRLRDGMTLYRWTLPRDISGEYKKQTSVEFKKQETMKDGKKKWKWIVPKSKDNHLTDCDQMCLVAALMEPRLMKLLWTGEEQQQQTETI